MVCRSSHPWNEKPFKPFLTSLACTGRPCQMEEATIPLLEKEEEGQFSWFVDDALRMRVCLLI